VLKETFQRVVEDLLLAQVVAFLSHKVKQLVKTGMKKDDGVASASVIYVGRYILAISLGVVQDDHG